MEIINSKPRRSATRLRTLFLKYLAVFGVGTICLLITMAILFSWCLSSGILLPANYAEKQVAEVRTAILAGQQLPAEDPERLYIYGRYTPEGTLLEGSLAVKPGSRIWNRLQAADSTYDFPYGYLKVSFQNEIYMFRYLLTVQFHNPSLRGIFPHVEFIMLVIFCIAFLGGTIGLSSSFGRRLADKMSVLQETTQKIQAEDLNFTVQFSGIAEIDHILQSMDQMKTALKKSLTQQWRLEQNRRMQISALAHDVKTPLTIIRGNAELLSETEQTEEQKLYTEYITDSAAQLESYMKSLIEMVYAESSLSYHPEAIDLQKFKNKLSGQMLALAAPRDVTASIAASTGLPDSLHGDSALLERALMNIISNAMDHAPEGSTVKMTIGMEDDYIRFCVTDEGPGFSPEVLRRATEQFYMGDSSRRLQGHYGMGLYIARFIAQLHGGDLHIANRISAPGGQVTLDIPMFGQN
ncbi:two-component sensor histidine kinase [Paenibacillus antibioticophila]|uniref:histidine kinase n=1 Tax=Paenibacillus antibioticophila TaxID=1274374 RepID=A0A919XMC2_9BACL|nr:HAMP domain-containing sensor histidine kinase [Paenibacillus antibioticophila]GIO35419.1 two-component sensor histidine kinase [Paenibacillus antibioticophila]